MRFLVIGCGSIGGRHLKNIKNLGHEVFGCEEDKKRAREVSKAYGVEVFDNLNKALYRDYDGAFICTPTGLHTSLALKLARKGIHLFIEKPLSHNMKGVKALSEIVSRKRLTSLVACNTRFLPSLKYAKRLIDTGEIGKVLSIKMECGFYLPYWHPYEDYRKGYSANKRLGGGVIFDDIHEIDSVYWLMGKPKEIFCYADTISNLKIDTEDIAEIFLKFRSGSVAQIHLDYLQSTYRRYYEFIGEKGTIVWDYMAEEVKLYTAKATVRKVFNEKIGSKREIMFVDEVKYFIECIKTGRRSINDIRSAAEILEIALACHASARKKEIIKLW